MTPRPPSIFACNREREFCYCGEQMIVTHEKSPTADTDTGEFPMEEWHSCPRYFVAWWKRLLTLGIANGGGHRSHNARSGGMRTWA